MTIVPLSLIVLIPLIGGILLGALPDGDRKIYQRTALGISVATFLASLPMFFAFDPNGGMQFVESYPWIEAFNVNFSFGVDGISLLLVMLTTFLMPLIALSAWGQVHHKDRSFYACLLFLEAGMLGVFLAKDLFLFYVFWEVMLIPMYLLIGIWGGPRRIYAAVKFFIYTMVGSLLMFLAILYLYMKTGTYDLVEITSMITNQSPLNPVLSRVEQLWLFGAFALSFAIKVPVFPLHTWLPDAHVEAPTAGSVVLAGVLLKMGTYGFLRFCIPFFPQASYELSTLMIGLAVIGIIYGALMALTQRDIKKLIAYSSVSHMGFIVLGIFTFNVVGMSGGIIQMVNHGLSTGALFLMIGIIYERTHKRGVFDFGGLAKTVPVFATMFLIVTLSSIGVPGLNGFVGEFMILVGAFEVSIWAAVFAATGIVLGAMYMLFLYRHVIFGPVTNPERAEMGDVNRTERIVLLPIIILMFVLGLFPNLFLDKITPAVEALQQQMSSVVSELPAEPGEPR